MTLIKNYLDNFSQTEFTHMNNAGLAPISNPAKDKIIYWANEFYKKGFYTNDEYFQDVLQSRVNLSQLIGCETHEIAFFQSTASAISQIALEFPLQKGDEVLMWEQEYSSNLYPWQEACKRSEAHLKLIPYNEFAEKSQSTQIYKYETKLDRLKKFTTEKTKVIAISWVQFQTGAMIDLFELGTWARQNNIFTCIDIMQGLGVFPINMKKMNLDAVVGGSHKWLNAPVGVGYLALDQHKNSDIRPHNIGAYTFGTCDDPSDLACLPKKDASKFEAGSKQVLEITALGASIDLILKTGVENIYQQALQNKKKLQKILEANNCLIHSPEYSLITNWTHPEQNQIIHKLKSKNINFAMRGPGVRFSPHAYNVEADFDKIDKVLKNR